MPISRFIESGPAIDEDDVGALEKSLGFPLPPQYRDFLLRVDGGRPDPEDAFWIKDDHSDGSLLNYFYAVKNEHSTLTILQRHRAFRARIPSDLLPIANDAGGSQICIGISKKRMGKIYFWRLDDETTRPSYRNVSCMAENFDDFLESFFDADRDGWSDQGVQP